MRKREIRVGMWVEHDKTSQLLGQVARIGEYCVRLDHPQRHVDDEHSITMATFREIRPSTKRPPK